MKTVICEHCGAPLTFDENNGYPVCEYCGCAYVFPEQATPVYNITINMPPERDAVRTAATSGYATGNTKKKRSGKGAAWFFGIIFIMGGIERLPAFYALLYLLFGVYILPPLSGVKQKYVPQKWLRVSIGVLLVLLAVALYT